MKKFSWHKFYKFPTGHTLRSECDLFRCEPYMQLKMVNGSHSMWVPSVNDCLSNDWAIVE